MKLCDYWMNPDAVRLACPSYVQNDAQDPHKSLEWYKRTLGTQLPNETIFAVLTQFYNDLDRAKISSPTICTLPPSLSVSIFHPGQSFSDIPSSIEIIGYLDTSIS